MRQLLNSSWTGLIVLVIALATEVSLAQVEPATEQQREPQLDSQTDSKTDSQPAGEQKTADKTSKQTAALHAKLAKYLSGTKWTGQFTVEGSDETKTEHYEILTAEKNEVGDYWNLVARIKYGDHDQTLPLPPIEIKFADKTPVITIDKVRFPGFGTFDARVLIRQGKYAGTWAHSGGKGGHLFGTIEPMDEEEVKEKTKQVEDEVKEQTKQVEDDQAEKD